MKVCTRLLAYTALLLTFAATSHAAPTFGAYARAFDDRSGGEAIDGGPGSSSASLLAPVYQGESGLGGATYTPILKASSVSVNAQGADDYTSLSVEAYQTFTSSIGQTITLDLSLDGIVTHDGTPISSSYILADIKVIGGSGFSVSDTYCSGQYAFGVYLCGSNLGSSNLYIPDGPTTLLDSISFNVSAGEQFAVYGILRANSRDGSADAFNTLEMSFQDDTYIEALPGVVPEPSTAVLCGGGLIVLGLRRWSRR